MPPTKYQRVERDPSSTSAAGRSLFRPSTRIDPTVATRPPKIAALREPSVETAGSPLTSTYELVEGHEPTMTIAPITAAKPPNMSSVTAVRSGIGRRGKS